LIDDFSLPVEYGPPGALLLALRLIEAVQALTSVLASLSDVDFTWD
jgi:hypothetical protein